MKIEFISEIGSIKRIHFFKFDGNPVDFDNNFYVYESVFPYVERGDLILRFYKKGSKLKDLRGKGPADVPIDVGNGGHGFIDILKQGFGIEVLEMQNQVRITTRA